MEFTKNPAMEVMALDDGENVVFDPATGDTHFLNTVGADIIRLLETPKSIDELATALASEYDADATTIMTDAEPFITELKDKNIIICTT